MFQILLLVIAAIFLLLAVLGLKANEANWGAVHSNILDGLLRLYCKKYHRLTTSNVNLPEQGAAIIACNHISGLDPFLIFAACKRPIHFLIAEDQYNRFGVKWLFKLAGCIPVDTTGRSNTAVRAAVKSLEQGHIIALFPQGGIHREEAPRHRLKRGVHTLASLSGAPVYPFHISNVKGEGSVVRSVIQRGNPILQSFPPIDCAGMELNQCLDTLANYMKVQHS